MSSGLANGSSEPLTVRLTSLEAGDRVQAVNIYRHFTGTSEESSHKTSNDSRALACSDRRWPGYPMFGPTL